MAREGSAVVLLLGSFATAREKNEFKHIDEGDGLKPPTTILLFWDGCPFIHKRGGAGLSLGRLFIHT